MNNNYKSFPSDTRNGGLTIILPNLEEAIKLGATVKPNQVEGTCNCEDCKNNKDKDGWRIGHSFNDACMDIYKPDPIFLEKVEDAQEALIEVVQLIEPSMKPAYEGFGKRKESDGLMVDAGLLVSGDPLPFLDHKESEYKVKPDISGEGAYRILICTDVSWWGNPEMNCGVVGAFVTLLQQFRPVEIWIQQAWLDYSGNNTNPKSGVTLFKLEFAQGYSPQQIAFWVTSEFKDSPFSWAVNKALGRNTSGTSTVAEIECDLWLRGDWMKLAGMDGQKWGTMLYTDKIDWVATWVAKTAKQVAIIDPNEGQDSNKEEGGIRS